jgi:Subtilase family
MVRFRRMVVVCCTLASLAASGQSVVSRTGVAMEAPAQRANAAIIEFREPVRAASGGVRNPAVAAEARRRTLQADLDRIARPGGRLRVRQVYAHAFSGAAVTIPAEAWDDVAKLPYVKRVHADLPVRAFVSQSVPQVGAPAVWAAHGTRGRGVVVAVIDTGIDYNHPALGGGIGPGFRVAGGYDFINDDADPNDDHGHGTHVAGIVGASSNTLTGVAPESTLLAYKALDAGGHGEFSGVVAAIDRALDPDGNGDPSDAADVINLSLGGYGTPEDPVAQAVENAIAHGVVVVAAAGNTGDFYSIGSPACAPNAITVGASELSGALAPFTSKGPNTHLYTIKPEVVAPGVNIVSAVPGGGQRALNGTSMAAPHVAGAAALLLAVHPEWTPAEVKSALVTTAFDLNAEAMAQGAGRIDVAAAAGATVFMHPATLSFGLADVDVHVWAPSQVVRITNRGTSGIALEMPVAGSSGAAVPQWALAPAVTTLAPGVSADVTVSMTVDHTASPYPTGGSLTYDGAVTFAGARMPWSFVKASRIRVQVDEGTPTAFVSDDQQRYRVLATGTQVAESILPAGTYDVVTWIAHPEEGRLAVRENVEVRGTVTVDIATSMLRHTILMTAVDEHGTPLSAKERTEGARSYQNRFRLVYPAENLNSYYDSAFLDVPLIRTNDIPSSWQLLFGEFYEDVQAKTSYAVQHPPLHGVDASVVLGSPRLREQEVRVIVPLDEPQAHRVSLGNAKHDRYPERSIVEATAHVTAPAPGDLWTGRVFMTRDVDPTYGFLPTVGLQGLDYEPPAFDETPLRLFGDGRVAVASGSVPGPAAQWHAPGSPVTLGGAPVHPEIEFHALTPMLFHAHFLFHGPNREIRWRDLLSTRWAASDPLGQSIGSGMMVDSNLLLVVPLPGPFELELRNDRYRAGAMRGVATYRAWPDTRRVDAHPPSFSALSVQSADGQQLDSVQAGSDAWLLFGIADWELTPRGREHKAIPAAKTRVEYRVSGTAPWIAADPQFLVQDFSPGNRVSDGAVYRCRIPAAPLAQAMDVRITAEDEAGNRMEYTLEPAFAVAGSEPGGPRRRSVRH